VLQASIDIVEFGQVGSELVGAGRRENLREIGLERTPFLGSMREMPQRKIPGVLKRPAVGREEPLVMQDSGVLGQEAHYIKEQRPCTNQLREVVRSEILLGIGGAFPDDVVSASAPLVSGVEPRNRIGTSHGEAEVAFECPEDRVVVIKPGTGPEWAVQIRG